DAHADAVWLQLPAEHVRQAEHRVLRRRVHPHAGERDADAVLGPRVQDMRRPPGGEEARYEYLASVDDAPDVHGEEPFRIPQRGVRDRPERADASVVAEEVNASERRPRALGEGVDRRALRDIARDADASHPGVLDRKSTR